MENFKKHFVIRPSSIVSFTLAMVGVMIMVTIQLLGVHVKDLFSPVGASSQVKSIEAEITPRLERIKNTFKIKEDKALIPQAYAAAAYDEAKGYAVVDYETGEVVLSKNLSSVLPIASITKVMTAVVALDLADPDEEFTVTSKAAKMIPTKIGVVEGQTMTLAELLNAALLTSANDATEVIEAGIDAKYGPGTTIFAMNEKARLLGMSNSQFTNPQGFDNRNHHSSPEDVIILARYALANYPLIAEITKKDYEFLPESAHHKQFDLYNWNGLLGVYPGIAGVKIGNTGRAGYTTVVTSERESKKYLAVVLGAPGVAERDLWASQLLDVAFQERHNLPPVEITAEELDAKYKSWHYWN